MWAVYVRGQLKAMFIDEDAAYEWAEETWTKVFWSVSYHEVEIW